MPKKRFSTRHDRCDHFAADQLSVMVVYLLVLEMCCKITIVFSSLLSLSVSFYRSICGWLKEPFTFNLPKQCSGSVIINTMVMVLNSPGNRKNLNWQVRSHLFLRIYFDSPS